jgi:ribosomal protein L37AE/L43A
MNKETSINCPVCKRTVPVIDIRIHEGKRICGGCFAKHHGEKFTMPQDHEFKKKEKRVNEIKFYCNSCGYKFFRPEGFDKKHVCPFCGEQGTIQRETTSQDFISSITRETDILE